MLHLINGQCTVDVLIKSNIAGEKFSVDDILMEGPLSHGLQSKQDWQQRADWLNHELAIPAEQYLQSVEAREQVLARCTNVDEIVLWYENDVFCQINFLYIIDRLSKSNLHDVRLCEVCPDKARLGLLDTTQLQRLFKNRTEISANKFTLVSQIWQAVGSGTNKTNEMLENDFSAWPQLRRGLQLYVEYHGDQQQLKDVVMNAVASGKSTLEEILAAINHSPATSDYGLGDIQLARLLRQWNIHY